ncbi:hypothetical protein M405DRAFT_806056 [Rhizopogon salebrosus TDB-379]|nr:hypothetical protein M405DRAFT_806056 [Rhizopogon salebrosus TDB-379]
MINRMQLTSSVDTPPGSFPTMSSSSYPLSLGSTPASLIRVIPRSPLTLQSHPRTRAKDRSSKNTPTNCDGLRYRTPDSSHLPHPQVALSTGPCSRPLGTPPVSQLPLQEYAYQLSVSTSRSQHPKPTPTPTHSHFPQTHSVTDLLSHLSQTHSVTHLHDHDAALLQALLMFLWI